MSDQIIVCIGKTRTAVRHIGGCVRRHSVLVAVLLLLTALISPKKVQGQLPSPCCAVLAAGLGTINSTLGTVIGGGLQAINSVLSDIGSFEQIVIWPKQAIAQAFGMAGLIQGFYGVLECRGGNRGLENGAHLSIDLANNGAHLKLGSAWAVTTQQNITTTLQHK